jgi:hypothetical protein
MTLVMQDMDLDANRAVIVLRESDVPRRWRRVGGRCKANGSDGCGGSDDEGD